MSVRLGTPFEQNLASAVVTSLPPNGRLMTINPSSLEWVLLNWVFGLWTTSSTVGNRVLGIQVKDSAGNTLYSSVSSAVVAASIAANISFGMAAPFNSSIQGTSQFLTVPIPGEFVVPAGATVAIVDFANIALGDTLAMNMGLVY